MGLLNRGWYFGLNFDSWMCYEPDDLIRSASVVAREDTRALCIDQWDLRKAIVKYPALAIELLQMLNGRLRAVDKNSVNTIGTLLPICAHCKKIKDQNGAWLTIEEFIADHTESMPHRME